VLRCGDAQADYANAGDKIGEPITARNTAAPQRSSAAEEHDRALGADQDPPT